MLSVFCWRCLVALYSGFRISGTQHYSIPAFQLSRSAAFQHSDGSSGPSILAVQHFSSPAVLPSSVLGRAPLYPGSRTFGSPAPEQSESSWVNCLKNFEISRFSAAAYNASPGAYLAEAHSSHGFLPVLSIQLLSVAEQQNCLHFAYSVETRTRTGLISVARS